MKWLLGFAFLLSSISSWADSHKEIAAAIVRAGLDFPVERIVPSPVPGLYQVELKGGRIVYSSPDGKFIIQGYVYEVLEKGVRNLTAEFSAGYLADLLAKVPESELVVFPARKERGRITVFMDVECPFCHKLHEELSELNAQGITVRYMAFPRKGIATQAYTDMVSVWCSKDRNEAFESAMDGDELDELTCANPVSAQYELGRQIGVQGTPTILFDNGRLVTGYKTADEVVKLVPLSAVNN